MNDDDDISGEWFEVIATAELCDPWSVASELETWGDVIVAVERAYANCPEREIRVRVYPERALTRAEKDDLADIAYDYRSVV